MTNYIILSAEIQRRIEHSLKRFLALTNAEHAVFAAKSGEILEHRGVNFGGRIISITALLTGVFNVTQGLAELIDECEFEQFFLKGREWKLFYKKITPLFILIVLFKESSLLGTVRISAEKFANDLKKIFAEENEKRQRMNIQSGDGKEEEALFDKLFK